MAGAAQGKGSGVMPAQRPRSALVLVHDEALRTAVGECLLDAGWEVFDVETWEAAALVLRRDRPTVMVLDPGLALSELDAFLATLDDRPSAPSLVVLSDLVRAANVAEEHHVLFVREPFDIEELVAAVERARIGSGRPQARRSVH